MDELDRRLAEHVLGFGYLGAAVLRTLAALDSEGRALELANYRLLLAGDHPQAAEYARRYLELADRALIELHFHPGDPPRAT